MILADDKVKEEEIKMIKRFAIEAGFEYSKIDAVVKIIMDGVREDISEEALFNKFKKKLLG